MSTNTDERAIERESVELLTWFVRGVDENDELIDPTDDVPKIAFVATSARPADDDWEDGTWLPAGPFSSTIGSAYQAEIEVGGTGTGAAVELDPGRYAVYTQVKATPETPVLSIGRLHVR